jgi:hypothetical protein
MKPDDPNLIPGDALIPDDADLIPKSALGELITTNVNSDGVTWLSEESNRELDDAAVVAYHAIGSPPTISVYAVGDPAVSTTPQFPQVPDQLLPLAPTDPNSEQRLAWEMLRRLLEVFDERGRRVADLERELGELRADLERSR